MFPWPPGTPLLHHIVSRASLPLQLLGPQDFVHVMQAVFGWWCAVGVVGHGGVQAAVLRGGEVGGRAVSVEQGRLVVVGLLPMVERQLRPFRRGEGDASCLDTRRPWSNKNEMILGFIKHHRSGDETDQQHSGTATRIGKENTVFFFKKPFPFPTLIFSYTSPPPVLDRDAVHPLLLLCLSPSLTLFSRVSRPRLTLEIPHSLQSQGPGEGLPPVL